MSKDKIGNIGTKGDIIKKDTDGVSSKPDVKGSNAGNKEDSKKEIKSIEVDEDDEAEVTGQRQVMTNKAKLILRNISTLQTLSQLPNGLVVFFKVQSRPLSDQIPPFFRLFWQTYNYAV